MLCLSAHRLSRPYCSGLILSWKKHFTSLLQTSDISSALGWMMGMYSSTAHCSQLSVRLWHFDFGVMYKLCQEMFHSLSRFVGRNKEHKHIYCPQKSLSPTINFIYINSDPHLLAENSPECIFQNPLTYEGGCMMKSPSTWQSLRLNKNTSELFHLSSSTQTASSKTMWCKRRSAVKIKWKWYLKY